MMQQLGRYVLTVVTTALICGMVTALFRNGVFKSLIRLCCGVILVVTVLAPIKNWTLPDFSDFSINFELLGSEAAAEGKTLANQEIRGRIKTAVEEYICSKANDLGVAVQVNVALDGDGYPASVQLFGELSDTTRQALQKQITNDLGIRKESQQWNGASKGKP